MGRSRDTSAPPTVVTDTYRVTEPPTSASEPPRPGLETPVVYEFPLGGYNTPVSLRPPENRKRLFSSVSPRTRPKGANSPLGGYRLDRTHLESYRRERPAERPPVPKNTAKPHFKTPRRELEVRFRP